MVCTCDIGIHGPNNIKSLYHKQVLESPLPCLPTIINKYRTTCFNLSASEYNRFCSMSWVHKFIKKNLSWRVSVLLSDTTITDRSWLGSCLELVKAPGLFWTKSQIARLLPGYQSCQTQTTTMSRNCTADLDKASMSAEQRHMWGWAGLWRLAELRICLAGILRADDCLFSSCTAPWLVRQLEILTGGCTNSICWRNNFLWQW